MVNLHLQLIVQLRRSAADFSEIVQGFGEFDFTVLPAGSFRAAPFELVKKPRRVRARRRE